METETRQQRRDRWYDACREQTARANLARERLNALNGVVSALQACYQAYEGNPFKDVLNDLFSEFMRECLSRRPKLKECIVESDTQSARYLELLENDSE